MLIMSFRCGFCFINEIEGFMYLCDGVYLGVVFRFKSIRFFGC